MSRPNDKWYCHECHSEMSPIRVPEPQCPNCGSAFVEEIPSDPSSTSSSHDPRAFDPIPSAADFRSLINAGRHYAGQEPPLGFAFNDGRGGGADNTWQGVNAGRSTSSDQTAGGAGGRVYYSVQLGGPGGNLPGGGGAAAANGPLAALMQAMGWNPNNQNMGGEEQDDQDDRDPDDVPLPPNNQRAAPQPPQQEPRGPAGGNHQVPIGNLAAFLGEAFGPQLQQERNQPHHHDQHHAANDPHANPFAEGGVSLEEAEDWRQEQEERRERGGEPPATPLNYLLSLLQTFGAGQAVFGGAGFGLGMPQGGRMGDFAWGEQGFQQILQELMDQAAGRSGPQPATEEIIKDLPKLKVTKEVLDLATIKDCPICQDDYELDDEIITLPCRHAYHPDCITKWLRSSGTCPVCRFALVPQPTSTEPAPPPSSSPDATSSSSSPTASTSTSTSRPQPPRRQTSTSTSFIPEVSGSRLPGSFPLPSPREGNEGGNPHGYEGGRGGEAWGGWGVSREEMERERLERERVRRAREEADQREDLEMEDLD